jgi:hypothetical protein
LVPRTGQPRLDNNGRPRTLQHGDMRITHNAGGRREIRIARQDGSGVFVGRGGHGYVQHPYLFGRRAYIQRTYYAHGTAYARFYRPYTYHGASLAAYTPALYYSPAYYGWLYNSQAAIPYGAPPDSPFAVYYASYFVPSPVEPGAPYWLADYIVSANLADAYQAQLDAANGVVPPLLAGISAPVTPEVKQLIAEEVKRQISRENTEAQQVASNADPDPASSGLGRMLDNTSHVFVAGADLDVLDNRGQECALGPGDVLQLATPPPEAADTASLVVLASKPRECVKGDVVSVRLADLQDMQNHMRETIDTGMADIQANAGQRGWPTPPQSAVSTGTTAPFAASAPPPDANAASEIAEQVREADRAEQESVDPGQPALRAIPGAKDGPDGSCAAFASRAIGLMENPVNGEWMRGLATPLSQIRSLGLDGYIRQSGGIAAVTATTRRDLATQEGKGQKDLYGIALNQAWIGLLDCMSRNALSQ